MPVPSQFPEGQVPTIITKPNQRYATTALSTEYRRFAVNGELLKDNTTGELFLKRKEDGKVVSFFQNKKYMHDMMLELRVLLNNNANFRYPIDSEEAFLLSTNYDLIAMNQERITNIYNENHLIDNTSSDPLYTFRFKLSKISNGFFCRISTRDCDKPLMEVITNYYNRLINSYNSIEVAFLLEKDKMEQIPKWYDSNATIEYLVKCIGGGIERNYTCTDYVRVNESCMVPLPEIQIHQDFPSGIDNIEVTINTIRYDKLHFIIEQKDVIGPEVQELIDRYIFQAGRMEAHVVNIMHFVDRYEDYLPLGNEVVLAFIDMPYANRYLGKMTSLLNNGDFIFSIKRPVASEWVTNGVWAEMVRTIDKSGNEYNTGSENSGLLDELEDIFGPTRIHNGVLTVNPEDRQDYLLDDIITVGGA